MRPKLNLTIVAALLLFLVGCARGPFLPEGNVAAGRQAFSDLGCHACHRVQGESFPEPVAQPPVPFALGSPTNPKSRQYLAESIIAPSHKFARKAPVYTEPGVVVDRYYEDIREGDESRMGSFNDHLTVQQWLDLVTFLASVQERGSQ